MTASDALERLLPVASTLRVLSLFGNKLAGTFPADSVLLAFQRLSLLHLSFMDLSGARRMRWVVILCCITGRVEG